MKKIMLTIIALVTVTVASGQLRNPIIGGYHPDPSVCRVGDTFYLVNSSFQYFPGVPIYKSTDLVNWTLAGNVLTRDSQLPLKGANSWLGIYAPTIRYNDGTYYMITTNVGNGGNFMVTAKDPAGPWSEPLWLEQQGIDPSLYFENGKCYMVSNPDNTIMLCEIDPKSGKTLSKGKAIWRGTGGRYPEGPHIYKKDGYYYLLISEGGTELAHKLTIARSKNIYGPYESNPANPILTNCNMKGQSMQIQGTGHGDFVQAVDGSWWIVFLAYRNFGGSYHHLGRETYLAPVEWQTGAWPVVNGGEAIDTVIQCKTLAKQQNIKRNKHYTFDKPLEPEWVYQQNPLSGNYTMQNGLLCMESHGTLTENNNPTFLGIRQESANMRVETEVISASEDALAGLTVYQINDGHTDLFVGNGKVMVRTRMKSVEAVLGSASIPVDVDGVRLAIESDGDMYRFYYRTEKDKDFKLLAVQNCSLLSTEVVGGFTGVTIGMAVESGESIFGYFDYQER